jgi:short-chain fatty acids transporter
MRVSNGNQAKSEVSEQRLIRFGLTLADWSERWFPDPLVFALLGVLVVFAIGVATGESPTSLAIQGGRSFWSLSTFTVQMVMVIIGGYVVASAPLAGQAIERLARLPKTPRGAVALVAFFSMVSALISWGLSLIFSALLVRKLAQRMDGLDYRAAGAAAYLGLGTVWALGLSSSAALLMATKASMPAGLLSIGGVIPLTQTIFLWQSLAMAATLIATSVSVAYLSAPPAGKARTATHYGIDLDEAPADLETRSRPGEWLEYSPALTVLVGLLLCGYLVNVFRTSPNGVLAALDLNTYNLIFITAGMLLQWRPRRLMRAVAECVPGAGGILIQFPLYAMIFGMITGTGLSDKAARLFASISTHDSFALLVGLYSAALGVFIPSGGSKWIVEAPYVLKAAIEHQLNLGWVVQTYNACEALPNLINPFYMLPLLGILHLRARDLAGYGMLQLIAQTPVVFFLCWLFAHVLPFTPPIK